MATQTATITETNAPARTSAQQNEELVENALKVHTKPLWTQMAKLNPPAPNPTCIPHIWRYDEVRPSLLRAGEIVPEEQAERRVLMLVNPARGSFLLIPFIVDHTANHNKMLHIPLILYTLGFSSLCQMKQQRPTDTRRLRCDSSSKVQVASLPFMASESPCKGETLSSRPPGTGMIMAKMVQVQ